MTKLSNIFLAANPEAIQRRDALRGLATKAYAGRTYDGKAYTTYAAAVEEVVRACGPQNIDVEIWESATIAAWGQGLLDQTVVPESAISEYEITECAGTKVFDIIRASTHQEALQGHSELKDYNEVPAEILGAIMLKLAERIVHLESACASIRSTVPSQIADGTQKAQIMVENQESFAHQYVPSPACQAALSVLWARLLMALKEAQHLVEGPSRFSSERWLSSTVDAYARLNS